MGLYQKVLPRERPLCLALVQTKNPLILDVGSTPKQSQMVTFSAKFVPTHTRHLLIGMQQYCYTSAEVTDAPEVHRLWISQRFLLSAYLQVKCRKTCLGLQVEGKSVTPCRTDGCMSMYFDALISHACCRIVSFAHQTLIGT